MTKRIVNIELTPAAERRAREEVRATRLRLSVGEVDALRQADAKHAGRASSEEFDTCEQRLARRLEFPLQWRSQGGTLMLKSLTDCRMVARALTQHSERLARLGAYESRAGSYAYAETLVDIRKRVEQAKRRMEGAQ